MGRRLALLVATDIYQDPAFRQLHAPSADVAALRTVLADPVIGAYEVQLLSNAVSHQVNQAIESFFAEASLKDLVILYFSGHGFKDDSGRLYLITKDSQRRLLASTAVSAHFVREQLDRCRSRRKVVLLDCCYAGAFPDGVARGTDTVDVLERLSGRGSAVMTASSALGYAFESGSSSSVTTVNDVAKPSVFTNALIDGLATGSADQNGDGLIDIDELYDHLYERVREANPQQTPEWRGKLEGTLYVATSPRGPRPAQLSPELSDLVQSPVTSARLAVVNDLAKLCSGAHLRTAMAARAALTQLAEDDSRRVAAAAQSALDAINERVESPPIEAAQREPKADAQREANKILGEARDQAEQIIADARTRGASLDRDARERHRMAMGSLVQTREELERRVDDLRAFEREYRSRLKVYFEGQLRDLEASPQLDEVQPEELGLQVDDLRAFVRESRSRLKAYFEGQLRDLQAGAT